MKRAMKQSTLILILNGISILALLFLVVSLFSYSGVSKQLNDASEERFELTYNANRFMDGSAYLTNEVRAFAATGGQEHYDNYWREVNELKNRDKGVAALQEIGITEQEQEMIDRMSSLSNELVPLEDEAMKEVQAGEREKAIEYVYGTEYSASIAKINELKEAFLSALDTRSLEQLQALEKREDYIEMTMICALVMVGIITVLNMAVTRIQIMRPVLAVKNQIGEISRGNLSAKFSLESNTSEIGMLVESIHETRRELKKYIQDIDYTLAQMAQGNMNLTVGNDYLGEFAPIQAAMGQILDALNTALSRIHVTAQQVSEESVQMATDAQTLSSGSVEQAAAVQELSASIQDISRQVDRTSEDAGDARTASEEAAMQLEICDRKMEALTAAMEDISKSSQQIGGIIKTMEDIAFQTKILSLNASVEAARAGEAGRSFSVVADEVQTLANKSSASAHNITQLIENSMQLVAYGASLSSDTTEALAAVISSARKSTEIVERIAGSAVEQSQSLKQLTLGMEQISEVVQTNAATAEKSAASARELSGQAEELKVAVQRFRLRER
ncbi:MAG: methyl-accepting chemotaxis protein [Lachnospiraceae bacterium]|nr:methyl-accepting chemotaxis protein [Lachnospiraceae bacterium]